MRLHQLIAEQVIGERVLDIGFAYGPNTYIKDKILYGVDIAKAEKPANYLEVKRADLNKEALPFENNFFDTVIMADVIEHVDNPSQTLGECYRVLKDGGRLIISTPQAHYIYDLIKNLLYSFFKLNLDSDKDLQSAETHGTHLSNWPILDFRRLLRKNFFELENFFGTYIHLPFHIRIPVHSFPILGWQIIYVSKKTATRSVPA